MPNAFWQVFFSIHITKVNLNKPLSSPIRAAPAAQITPPTKQVSNLQWNGGCKLPHPIFRIISIVTERHKIIYRNICTSAAENTFNIWWWKGSEGERVSNNTHIPLHKNNKWIKALSIYAEKTYIGVFPFTVIAESHRPIGHQPEPKECEREVRAHWLAAGFWTVIAQCVING